MNNEMADNTNLTVGGKILSGGDFVLRNGAKTIIR